MSYKEALADGIRYEKGKDGNTLYFPPCQFCGREAFSLNYIASRRYTCNICKLTKALRAKQSKGMARMRKF